MTDFCGFRPKNRFFLAPMAGITDAAFRTVCAEFGAAVTYTEMVSAKALVYDDKKTAGLLEMQPAHRPCGAQLFGHEPEVMAEAARRARDICHPDFIDINMGCPVPKVVKNGEGSALMKNPKLVYELVNATVKAIKKPVTVKIRKGFDDAHVNAVEIARIAEEAGAAAVAVHGRTREQYYSGKADWDIIRQVKEAVHIPVIGNGDVTSGEKAIAMREQTGCDGVMIARGAQGNPWIFSELLSYEQNGTIPARPTTEEVREMILRHAKLQIEYKGEYAGIREMRKHMAWYTKGIRKAAKIREKINMVETLEEVENLLTSL